MPLAQRKSEPATDTGSRHLVLDRFGRPATRFPLPNIWIPKRRIIDPRSMPHPGIAPQVTPPPASEGVTYAALAVVGFASGGTTVSIPAHLVGDLICIHAYRSNATPATIPGDFTTIISGGASSCSLACGWKIADTTTETSGTWSNANRLLCWVWRTANQVTPIGNVTAAMTNSATTITFPAITRTAAGAGNHAFVAIAGINSGSADDASANDLGWDTAHYSPASGIGIITHQQDSSRASDFAQTNRTLTAARRWRTFCYEILAAQNP